MLALGFVAAAIGRDAIFLAGSAVAVAGLALVAVTRLGAVKATGTRVEQLNH